MESEKLIMHCAKATRLLQLYLDKQLTFSQMHALEVHIASCSACREELFLLENIERALHNMILVAEPADLAKNVMRRVALSPQQTQQANARSPYALFRLSLLELLTAVLLASVATLGIIMEQPTLRDALPIANGHDRVSQVLTIFWSVVLSVNSQTLTLLFWIIGTILGIWITLAVAGTEMRTVWFKSVMDRLPVW